MNEQIVTLDVREDFRKGRDPFSRISQTVAGLQGDQKLLLRAPFEPRPLFHVLAGRGFSHQARQLGAGEWEILFTRDSDVVAEMTPALSHSPCGGECAQMIELDVRGLEPPQPLVKILEALSQIPLHGIMHAHTDRRPMHLYAQLAERGFAGESEEQKDGSFITHIRHG